MRIKEKVKVEIDGEGILIKDLKEGFYEVKIVEKKVKVYKKKDKKDNIAIITREDLKTVKKAVKTYLRRSLVDFIEKEIEKFFIRFLVSDYR